VTNVKIPILKENYTEEKPLKDEQDPNLKELVKGVLQDPQRQTTTP
jgi:hypothetical protein